MHRMHPSPDGTGPPIELGTVTNTRGSLSGCGSVRIDELNPNDILRFTTVTLGIVLVYAITAVPWLAAPDRLAQTSITYSQFNDSNLPFDGNVT
jgi:hypothetical protein